MPDIPSTAYNLCFKEGITLKEFIQQVVILILSRVELLVNKESVLRLRSIKVRINSFLQ